MQDNQESKIPVLPGLTERVVSASTCCRLAVVYPAIKFRRGAKALGSLDSHCICVYSSVIGGGKVVTSGQTAAHEGEVVWCEQIESETSSRVCRDLSLLAWRRLSQTAATEYRHDGQWEGWAVGKTYVRCGCREDIMSLPATFASSSRVRKHGFACRSTGCKDWPEVFRAPSSSSGR